MSQTSPVEPEPSWQQPAFGDADADAAPPVTPMTPGQQLVPAAQPPEPPPTALESVLNVAQGVLWPLVLGLVFLGVGNWVLNVVIAIVLSTLLGGVSAELKRRRIPPELPPAGPADLR